MSSINISLNADAYARLVRLKRKSESFSQAVVRLAGEKDIRRCYGLLKDEDDGAWDAVSAEVARVRRLPLRGRLR